MSKKPTYEILESRVKELEKVDQSKNESDELLKLIIFSTSTSEAIAVHKDGVLIEANDQFFNMFEYERNELVGINVIPLIVNTESIEKMKKQIYSLTIIFQYDHMTHQDGIKFLAEYEKRDDGNKEMFFY